MSADGLAFIQESDASRLARSTLLAALKQRGDKLSMQAYATILELYATISDMEDENDMSMDDIPLDDYFCRIDGEEL